MLTRSLKPKKCRNCRDLFAPVKPMQKVCNMQCALILAVKDRAKKEAKEAKAERMADNVKRASLKTLRELIEDAQREFNKWTRLRDAQQPCICCGKPFEPQRPGGAMDAGHYLARSVAPQHRFTEDNCFGQRKNCNRPGGTTRAAFRAGVIARIGLERVEALEADTAVRKWTREELIEIKRKYAAKARELMKKEPA